ncbi:MAG: queuosine salvage family protein [Phycisphaerae bacterium]
MIVLDTTRAVVAAARRVRLDDDAISTWAATLRGAELAPSGHGLLADLPGSRRQIANLVLLADALNFCFWGPRPEFTLDGQTWRGFEAFLASLIAAVRTEPRWFDPRYWTTLSAAAFRAALDCGGALPLVDERDAIARQTGQTLIERFDGQFFDAVDSVNHRAWDLAMLLLTNFDSFRDVAEYAGQPVFFAKRAQIAALDLSVAWQAAGHDGLEGLEALTAFADYRLPQALRHLGIVAVEPELARQIDQEIELAAGGPDEVELRAATVVAVDRMVAALAQRRVMVPAWQIDWWLWNRARQPDVQVAHHRTRTTFY